MASFFTLSFECKVSKLLSIEFQLITVAINSHFYINSICLCEQNEVKKKIKDSYLKKKIKDHLSNYKC